MSDYGPRETNERPWNWGRITEHVRIVRALQTLGAVVLSPRPKQTGFGPPQEEDADE